MTVNSATQAPPNPENQKQALEAEKAFRQGVVTVRDLIAPSAMQVQPRMVRLGTKFVSTLFVISYPRYLTVSWFSPVINLNLPMDISMFFYPVSPEAILKQLRNKVGQLEAQLSLDEEHGAPRDPVRQTALRDIEKLRDDLTQGIEHFFRFALYITVYADNEKELEEITSRVENILGGKLVYSKRVMFQAEQGFNSTLPLGNDELYITFNLNTSPAASMFPFTSSELTSDNGILYGINQHNNSLILFDRFSLQNANSVVLAGSGAGKSYMVKLEVLRSLMLGTDVLIVDPESEYKYLSNAVGGTFIDISLNSEAKINPFDLPKGVYGNEKPADIIRSAVITLKGLIRLMLGTLTNEEDSIVDRALMETYARKDITEESDLASVEAPVLQDFQNILEGMEGAGNLVERLKKYTEGTFAGLFNSPTTVNVNSQLVVFSVRDLEDELRPMGVYTIMNYVWNIVRSQLKKRILVVDEAWWLMQQEDSAKFIYALVKRGRKYYLGITTISQDVNDFLRSPYGQAIVTNSELKTLMRQSTAGIDQLQKTFLLTQGERYLLLEAGVGEGIFFAGSKHAAIKVVASYTEDQIITSDPKQLLEIEKAKREFEEAQSRGESQTTPREPVQHS